MSKIEIFSNEALLMCKSIQLNTKWSFSEYLLVLALRGGKLKATLWLGVKGQDESWVTGQTESVLNVRTTVATTFAPEAVEAAVGRCFDPEFPS